MKKKEFYRIVLIFSLIVFLFGGNCFVNFATDTYATFMHGDRVAKDMLMRNGRAIIGIFYWLWQKINISNELFYYLSYCIAIINIFFAVSLTEKEYSIFIPNKHISVLASFTVICNIFIIEYMMFIEKGMFMFAILLNVFAFINFVRYLQTNENKYIRYSLAFMIFAVFTYQGTVPLFIILSFPMLKKYSKNITYYIKSGLVVILIYMIPCMLNFLWLKTIGGSRVSGNGDRLLMEQIEYIVRGLTSANVKMYSIIPPYVYIFFVFIVIVLSVMKIIRVKDKSEKTIQLFNIFCICIFTLVVPIASIIISSGWFAPRVIYPMASLLGILVINYFVNIQSTEATEKTITNAFLGMIGLIILLQYFGFNRIYIDKYICNYCDKVRYESLGALIDEYEKESGCVIEKIVFYNDAIITPNQYSDLYYTGGDLVVSAFVTSWSDLNALNYYLKSNYSKGEKDDSIELYFYSHDWSNYTEEQIIFDGDTLHYCVY